MNSSSRQGSALQVLIIIFNVCLVIFLLGEHYFPPPAPAEATPEVATVTTATLNDSINALAAAQNTERPHMLKSIQEAQDHMNNLQQQLPTSIK